MTANEARGPCTGRRTMPSGRAGRAVLTHWRRPVGALARTRSRLSGILLGTRGTITVDTSRGSGHGPRFARRAPAREASGFPRVSECCRSPVLTCGPGVRDLAKARPPGPPLPRRACCALCLAYDSFARRVELAPQDALAHDPDTASVQQSGGWRSARMVGCYGERRAARRDPGAVRAGQGVGPCFSTVRGNYPPLPTLCSDPVHRRWAAPD